MVSQVLSSTLKRQVISIWDLPDKESAAGAHSGLDSLKDLDAVVIGPVVDDVTHPVYVGVLYRVLLKEVVLHELDAALLDCLRVLAGPDLGLSLVNDGATIFEHQVQVLVDVRQLKTEATWKIVSTGNEF